MKIALITGANKSIGYETAQHLAANDCFVYLGSRDTDNGRKAVERLKHNGTENVEMLPLDVSDAASVAAAREELGRKAGKLDILINNAGVSGGLQQEPSLVDMDVLRQVFDTNFFGAIQVTQAFMDLLKAADAPRIVNVTSGLASLTLHNDPEWKYYNFKGGAYGPSKTALNAYTIALAHELRDTNFKVNAVDPGYTSTDFNRHRGSGSVEDAAARIVKYALLDEDGPTGGYFSDDNNPETGVSPW